MAHFAQLDENNQVLQVIVVNNEVIVDETGNESEQAGVAFCQSLFGSETAWVQTSYNGTIRKNYAGTGFTYDSVRNAFIAPQPAETWTLDEETCQWIDPNPPSFDETTV